jgi:sec-independent protein translocase protein TatA
MNLGMTELIIVFAIILVLFGGKKLPGLGKALGDSIRGFKSGISGEDEKPPERQAQLPNDAGAPNRLSGQEQTSNPQNVSEKDKTNRS